MPTLSSGDKQQEAIKKLRHDAEENRARSEAEKLGIPYKNLTLMPISVEELVTLSETRSKKGSLVVLKKTGKTLWAGIRNPENPETQSVIEYLKEKGYTLRLFLISQRSLERAWKRYADYSPPAPTLKEYLEIQEKDLEDFQKEIGDIKKLKEKITTVSTTELLSTIISGAIKTESSDIHLEPTKDTIRLRYRMDGFLQDIVEFKQENYKFLLSRIKLLSNLKINIHDISQDGRFTIQIKKEGEMVRRIDNRVSIIPTGFGETVVIRLLGSAVAELKLEDLGIEDYIKDILVREISKPNGMILNTGPTGSGKTTTLYAVLNFLNKPGTKIITIENPIEYKLKGITQTQVNIKKGYTFKSGLAASLRQDPDVIMVGEIRDKEGASTAIHAALTGHLVFSTLHTNSASETITRLVDMGMEKKILPTAINAVIAQRLVRRLCEKCKEKYTPSKDTVKAFRQALSLISPKTKLEIPREIPDLYKAKGCSECFGLGYKGQVGIFEIFTINDKIEKLINKGSTSNELLATAMEEGMITMLQDGILKIVEGATSLEEVTRVAGDAKYIETIYGEAVSSLLTRNLEIEKATMEKTEELWHSKEEFEKVINDTPIEKLLELVVAGSIWARGTDIHLEPAEKSFAIRYRIDGILETAATLPKALFLPLLAEVKILSGLKTEVHKKIQESRFSIKREEVEGTQDTRVSIIPGGYGEAVVIRMLSKDIEKLKMADLGLRPEHVKTVGTEVAKPNGIVLITGPTSAGKTTTLYSILNEVNKPGVKILTAEDPIEYRLPGILQTQINEEEGYTFATALKSFLRQNPNIMMVGEIRDKETADIAIRAALTGHLVFSTLHTNNAIESIQRLSNIGLDARDIASALNLVIAQRLVRRLCTECRKEHKSTKEDLEFLKENLPADFSGSIESIKLYEPQGCDKCSPSGFKGQMGIFEMFTNSEKVQELIAKKASLPEIEAEAKITTMKQDGAGRAIEGVTTLGEVMRVTE